MTKEQIITERTRVISEMLDNPDKYGIYPTTNCFEQLDILIEKCMDFAYDKGFIDGNQRDLNH